MSLVVTLDATTQNNGTNVFSILTINPLMVDDEGDYQCVSSNGIEKELVKKVHLWLKGDYDYYLIQFI